MNFEEKFKNKLSLNIQRFAEEKEVDPETDDESKDKDDDKQSDKKDSKSEEKKSDKTYTDDEVNSISKKNVDKATKKH